MNTALHLFPRYFILLLFWCISVAPSAYANQEPNIRIKSDQVEAPYFISEGSTEPFPLKHTEVKVNILGIIADVEVTQFYHNTGTEAINAQYVFPGSTRAALYSMEVTLGSRVLKAKIDEKKKAETTYQTAKESGKTAALLTQQRPNVFQMDVANIMPQDEIKVVLRYTEHLIPTDNRYEFVYPTVVGPRYHQPKNTALSGQETWLGTPYLKKGDSSPATFNLSATLITPVPLTTLKSTHHTIHYDDPQNVTNTLYGQKISTTETQLRLATTSDNPDNRDFILSYELNSDTQQNGLILSKGEENFFLALMSAPKNIQTKMIVPRDYIFIVDISGSMRGFPIQTTKQLIKELIGNLRESDTFNIMLFSGSSTMLAPASLSATQQNIQKALKLLEQSNAGGSTELTPALKKALSLNNDADRARSFIVITDGYVSVEDSIFQLIRRNLNQANLFAFGIGSSVNRHLIEGMARAGQGEPFIVTNAADAAKAAQQLKKMIDRPILSHITATFEGLEVYDVAPNALPDLFAERPVVLYGKWRGAASGKLVLKGYSADGPYEATLPINDNKVITDNSSIAYLWARNKIAELMDEEDLSKSNAHQQSITELGLKYSLLTKYTAFIAVDEIVRNHNASATKDVQQPLPLAHNVENSAVATYDSALGTEVSATPEPEISFLILIALLSFAFIYYRSSKRQYK